MEFEWDSKKASNNVSKHGISFGEGASVFNDPLSLTVYDLNSPGTPIKGKYHTDYQAGTNLVLIDPDLAPSFPDARAVNDALRELLASRKKD